MPNPSTIQSELEEDYQDALARANNLSTSKVSREYYLGKARDLAAQLGIEGPPNINGRPAKPQRITEEQVQEAHRILYAYYSQGAKEGRWA